MSNRRPWQITDTTRENLPDFLIVGAMKAGTTSLHHILATHPDIFIPDGEIFFFTQDDIEQHPNHFFEAGDQWTFRDLDTDFDRHLDRYLDQFSDAESDQVFGEDSTTYLPSRKAPERIAELLPAVKLVAMLRDPVDRAYSHYWHLVRKGIALYDFETTLEKCPGRIFLRSFYEAGIRRFLDHFPRDQMKFVIFERFVESPQSVVDEVSNFLEVSPQIDVDTVQSHQNSAKVPPSPALKLLTNRIFRRRLDQMSAHTTLDSTPRSPSWWEAQISRGIKGLASALVRNRAVVKAERLLGRSDYPTMASHTRRFLERLFAKENRGLPDLIGKNLSSYWSCFDS